MESEQCRSYLTLSNNCRRTQIKLRKCNLLKGSSANYRWKGLGLETSNCLAAIEWMAHRDAYKVRRYCETGCSRSV
jgi:hypothetical protein